MKAVKFRFPRRRRCGGRFHVGGLVGENNGGILSGVFTDGKVVAASALSAAWLVVILTVKFPVPIPPQGRESYGRWPDWLHFNSKISGSCASSDVKASCWRPGRLQ